MDVTLSVEKLQLVFVEERWIHGKGGKTLSKTGKNRTREVKNRIGGEVVRWQTGIET